MRLQFLLAAIFVASAAALSAAPQAKRLEPTGPWVLDYADNSCRLSRVFGADKDEVVLQFESTAPRQMSMIAIGKRLDSDRGRVEARFLPVHDGEPFAGTPQISSKQIPGALWSYLPLLPETYRELARRDANARAKAPNLRPPPIDLGQRAAERLARAAFAAGTREIELRPQYSRRLILVTGELAKPIAAFDRCLTDSLRDWGVDPALEERIVRPVWAPGGTQRWFTSSDYPARMLAAGKESRVRVRLLVDATGKVTRCTSLSHFDEPEFQRNICEKFVERARFAPAELADGTKVPSYYITSIAFRLG